MSIRVMIVDDSPFVRRAVRRMLAADPDLEVVGEAADGSTALREVERLAPDVVTLDLRMPGLDGMTTLARLMARRPTPVVLLSAFAQADAALTVRALAAGAVDYVDKSRVAAMDVHQLAPELVHKLKVAAHSGVAGAGGAVPPVRWLAPPPTRPARLLVLGASTGGPRALETVLAGLPADLPAAVLVIQHMPARFTAPLARRLAEVARLPVREAAHGEALAAGEVLLAPGGRALAVEPGADDTVRLRIGEAGGRAQPRLDLALAGAAAALGDTAAAAILTGMGRDGAEGARLLRDAGGAVIAEAASTCVVYGMPRAAVEDGVASCVAPLGAIAGVLAGLVGGKVPA
jgi:two-component system, chemotaxis family, protein-glutamate methylesterase/glutaminase